MGLPSGESTVTFFFLNTMVQSASQMGPTQMSVLVDNGMMYPVVGKSATNFRIFRVAFTPDVVTFPLAVPTLIVAALLSSGPCGVFGAMYRCVSPESTIAVCCCGRIFSFSSYSVGIYVWVGIQLYLASYIKVSLLVGLCTGSSAPKQFRKSFFWKQIINFCSLLLKSHIHQNFRCRNKRKFWRNKNCRVGRADFLEFLFSEFFWNLCFQEFWFRRILEFDIWDFWKLVSEFWFCSIEYVVLLDDEFPDRFLAGLHQQTLWLLGSGWGKKTQNQLDRQSCLTLHLYFRRWLQKQRSKNWNKSRILTSQSQKFNECGQLQL